MLIRALIVLLVVLNLGVAAWWLTRSDPPPPSAPEIPAGVAILELVDTPQASPARVAAVPTAAVPPAAQATPGATASAASTPAGAPASACFRVGPFADRAAAEQSRGAFAPANGRAALRETPGTNASGYRVSLPPSATREEALAIAQRIGAAGFDDFLVINQGEETNGIALGRYRSREGAQRRQSQLVAAGFPARIHAIGEEGPSRWWLDVAAPAGTRAATLRASVAVPVEPQDCPAALR
ncbi:SPOR domain-containing protein [Pseudoxanthomonas beigongshangi]